MATIEEQLPLSDPNHTYYAYWRDMAIKARRVVVGLQNEIWDALRKAQNPPIIVFSSPYVHLSSPPGTMFTIGGNPGGAVLNPEEPAAVPFVGSNFYGADHIDSTKDILIVVDSKTDPTVQRALLSLDGKIKLGGAEQLWADRYIYPAIEAVAKSNPDLQGEERVLEIQKEVLRRSIETIWTYPGVQGGKKNFRVHAVVRSDKGDEIISSTEPGQITEFQKVEEIAEKDEESGFFKVVHNSLRKTLRSSLAAAFKVMIIAIRCSDSRDDVNLVVPDGYDCVVIAANAGALSPKPVKTGACNPTDVVLEQVEATGRPVIVQEIGHNTCGAVGAAVGAVLQEGRDDGHHHSEGHQFVVKHIKPILQEVKNLIVGRPAYKEEREALTEHTENNMAQKSLRLFTRLPLVNKLIKIGRVVGVLTTVFNFREGLKVLNPSSGEFEPVAATALNVGRQHSPRLS